MMPRSIDLGEAISALKLVDITLLNAQFDRPSPKMRVDESFAHQHFRQVVYRVFDNVDSEKESGEEKRFFVIVKLGVRLVLEPDKNEGSNDGAEAQDAAEVEPEVLNTIEANFIVEYAMKGQPSDESLAAFAKFNSVHNVWPFWRQHVFDIVQRGSLPKVDIPLFSGSPESSED